MQKLDGSPPAKVTDFHELDVLRFECCRGNEMLVVRGTISRDAVMIRLR